MLSTLLVILAASSPQIYYPYDVPAQIRSIAPRADAMGFHIGASPDPSMCYHYQSLARSNGPGTPYFFVSKSGNHPGGICVTLCTGVPLPCTEVGDGPGNLLVVRMGSRNTDGERLRSNRLARNTETEDSVPDASDVVVKLIAFDGTGGWPSYGHPGGMQVVGDVLAVALEKPYAQVDIDESVNAIQFIDVSNPENPLPKKLFRFEVTEDTTAGVVAIAPLPGGKHLMLITGKDGQFVRIFESNGEPLKSMALDFELKYTWRPGDNPVNPPCWVIPATPQTPEFRWGWPDGGITDYAHQQLNFFREGGPDGQLYLIGTRNSWAIPGPFGDDMIDVYRVSWDGSTFSLGCAAQKHVVAAGSSDDSLIFETKTTDFAAGGGIYVSPTGELIVYGSEHDNDGPGGTVKMGEFRSITMVRDGSPTLDPTVTVNGPYSVPEGSSIGVTAGAAPPRTKAWVQLFADPDDEDRYIVMDYEDWSRDDFDNFKDLDDATFNPIHEGFSDQASSARWFAPVGCTIRLNDDDFSDDSFPGDDTRTLHGTGSSVWWDDLDDIGTDDGDSDIADSLTSAQFFVDCDAYYDPATLDVEWDLDSDGAYETVGSSFSFSALTLDGPSSVPLRARVVHPMDGRVGFADSSVTVTNVAPAIGDFGLRDSANRDLGPGDFALLGIPITFHTTFTDPGRPDTHELSVDWGDGFVAAHPDLDTFTAATGGVIGSATDVHSYATSGDFLVFNTITDDDGGLSSSTSTLQVMTAEEALDWVIDQLPPGKARDHLDGSNNGAANNGAIDHLEAGRRGTALTMIALALRSITDNDLRATLALIAQSIATQAYAEAPPNKQPNALPYLTAGAAQVTAGNYEAAVASFIDAVHRS